jgi:hypothetical protein
MPKEHTIDLQLIKALILDYEHTSKRRLDELTQYSKVKRSQVFDMLALALMSVTIY